LERFWLRTVRCRLCPTIAPWRKFPARSHGTARYRLVIIGEAPGRVSLANGRAFSNPRNLTVRRAFARAISPLKLELEEVFYLTDVVKCWPGAPGGGNRSPRRSEIANCVERHLGRELDMVRPRLVFAFGAHATTFALGYAVDMVAEHGRSRVSAWGIRLIPLMHPSSINIVGMKRAGVRSLADYEENLADLFGAELRPLIL
jgi:uracil-DNA glycosylase family 4